jgi:hypothetical protein
MKTIPETTREAAQDGAAPVDASRRRLFRGVAGGAGVLLSVQAKTALGGGAGGGGVCQSPSAMMSGNASPRPSDGSCSGGRSPGYWVQPQHFGAWTDAGATPPTFSPAIVECSSGLGGLALSAIALPGTRFSEVFGSSLALKTSVSGVTADQADSLWAVIYDPNSFRTSGSISGQVARHLACAWLNAKYFAWDAAQYPITAEQVIEMWDQLLVSAEYCPASSCSGGGMTADEVKAYIEGMYDLNSPVPNYCKKT